MTTDLKTIQKEAREAWLKETLDGDLNMNRWGDIGEWWIERIARAYEAGGEVKGHEFYQVFEEPLYELVTNLDSEQHEAAVEIYNRLRQYRPSPTPPEKA